MLFVRESHLAATSTKDPSRSEGRHDGRLIFSQEAEGELQGGATRGGGAPSFVIEPPSFARRAGHLQSKLSLHDSLAVCLHRLSEALTGRGHTGKS